MPVNGYSAITLMLVAYHSLASRLLEQDEQSPKNLAMPQSFSNMNAWNKNLQTIHLIPYTSINRSNISFPPAQLLSPHPVYIIYK